MKNFQDCTEGFLDALLVTPLYSASQLEPTAYFLIPVGISGDGSSIPYAASKGALNTLTKSLARVLAPQIRVNAVCPDYISGRWLREGVGEAEHDRIIKEARQKSALDKIPTPDDISETVFWLVKKAGFITGENLVVDSGIHLRV